MTPDGSDDSAPPLKSAQERRGGGGGGEDADGAVKPRSAEETARGRGRREVRTSYSSYLTSMVLVGAVWLWGTLCLVAAILYVNIDNAVVEGRTRSEVSRSDRDRTKYVLLAVTLALILLHALCTFLLYTAWSKLLVEVELHLLSFRDSFRSIRAGRTDEVVLFCNSADEVRCIADNQVFPVAVFSRRTEIRAAERQLSLANLHIREARKLVAPDVLDEAAEELRAADNEDEMEDEEAPDVRGRGPLEDDGEPDAGAEEAEVRVGADSAAAAAAEMLEGSGSGSHSRMARLSSHGSGGRHSASSSGIISNAGASTAPAAPQAVAVEAPFGGDVGGHLSAHGTFSAVRSVRRRGKSAVRTSFDAERKPERKPADAHSLKRRRATVLVVSFTGFAEIAAFDKVAATEISSRFIEIVFALVRRFKGRVAQCRPDRVVISWNTMASPQPDHAQRGLRCGEMLGAALVELSEAYAEYDAAVGLSPIVIGFTGYVLAGIIVANERHFVIYGKCVDLACELLSLLYNLNVTFIWMDDVPHGAPPHLCAVPIDMVTDGDGTTHILHEMTNTTRRAAAALADAFRSFKHGDYFTAYHKYTALVADDTSNMMADRLRQLSFFYAVHDSQYSRPVPRWVVFDPEVRGAIARQDLGGAGAGGGGAEAWAQPAPLSMEELRRDINMAAGGEAPAGAPANNNTSGGGGGGDSASAGAGDASAAGTGTAASTATGGGGADGGAAASSSAGGGGEKNDTDSAESPTAGGGARPTLSPSFVGTPQTPSVTARAAGETAGGDFKDRQGLSFRVSRTQLGQTMTSEVYLGLAYTGGMVAIKMVNLVVQRKSEAPLNDINRRRLRRKGIAVSDAENPKANAEEITGEIELLSKLRHACIVGYVSSVVTGGKLMLIMEYVSGGSLKRILDQFSELSLPQARTYMKDVLRGLRYLHGKGIVHRDIKPQNVLVPDIGPCKLTDFGISREISKATKDLRLDGTPYYMAPEAARGEVTFKSDIWSFGIMMVQVLTNQLPWPDNSNPLSIRYRLGHEDNFRPEVRGDIPADAREVFEACTREDPEARPTAKELLAMPFFAQAVFTRPRRNSNRRASSAPSDGSSGPGKATAATAAAAATAVAAAPKLTSAEL